MFKKKIIILLIGFYVFWLGVLPLVLTNSLVVLCEKISSKSNYFVELQSPKINLSLLPTISLKAEKILISSKRNNDSMMIDGFDSKIRILPLLSGRLHLNNFLAKEIVTNLNLEQELALDKDFFNKLESTKAVCDYVNVKKFETNLFQRELKAPIKHYGNDLLFQRKNRYIKFQMKSNLKIAGKHSNSNWDLFLPKNNDIKKTIFDIQLSNFDITPLRVYLKHYLPDDLYELRGTINIHANKGELITEFKNCAAIMRDSSKSIILPEKMTVNSTFSISLQVIILNNMCFKSPHIHASLDGKIHNYLGKSMPSLDLNLRLDESRVEDIVSMLPAFNFEELNLYSLKKYKFMADVLANINIKGRLPEPDINGDIYISNGVLIKPIPNTTQGATIKIALSGRQADFDVLVPAGGKESVKVKGSQEIYNIKFADMVIKSTENVNLKSAQNVVNPLHEILNFIIGPVPIMDLNGFGNIDIVVKGNRKNPHVWGGMNINDGYVWFNEIPDLRMKDASAVLKFNDQNVVFNTKEGYVNGKDFKISGICNLNGKFDFDIVSKAQPTMFLYKAIQSSTMIPDIKSVIPKIDNVTGNTDLNLKIYGAVKSLNSLKFNENVFAKGNINIIDNNFLINDIDVKSTSAKINVDGLNIDTNINALIGESPLMVKAKVKKDVADVVLDIPKMNPNYLIKDEETRKKQYLPYISVLAKYKGDVNNIQFNKLFLDAKVLGPVLNSKVKINSGQIQMVNNKLNFNNIKGYVVDQNNIIHANLKVSEAFSKEPNINGNLQLKSPSLILLNDIISSDILPEKIKKHIKDFEFIKGNADLDLRFINNKLTTFVDLGGVAFKYIPLDLPVEIVNGSLSVKNNILKLNKLNMLLDNMPVLADGEIREIFDKRNFNVYVNSKPQQEFIDKYINKNQVYPIKIKGDIVYWARLKGVVDNFELKTKTNMSKDSSIYHFGATIGDIENAISVYLDAKIFAGNNLKIKEFSYDKVIDSLNGKQTELNLLKARGGVQILKEDLIFDDLQIKTSHPTDARIFNIIFRKPNIKQGQFTSDLKFNGKLSNPKVLGDFHIFETNIPFLDTEVKNVELIFKDKTIDLTSKGDILSNGFEFDAVLKNKLTQPYIIEKGFLYTKNLDLNRVVEKLKVSEVDNFSSFDSLGEIDLSLISFNNLRLKADNIKLRNIHATNFDALSKLSEKGEFDVSKFSFNIAQGMLNGKYQYNLKNNDMSLKFNVDNINANDITWALFDLNNQIYGDMTGKVELACNGLNFQNCMQTLNGNTVFNVTNGRMPKLGSLEYLLRAANLVKGGITGLSINSVIDIISPLKTGEFSDIFGSIRIKDGIARQIEITSKGKSLSLFMTGTYNFATSLADMQVYGLLLRKLPTMLGPIGNVSINTLFNIIPGVDLSKDSVVLERINKIPAIELSSKAYRKFVADIKGNINGDNYVTSFQWIN